MTEEPLAHHDCKALAEAIGIILSTQAKHSDQLNVIVVNMGEVKEATQRMEHEGLSHLKSIADSTRALSTALQHFSTSDELKVKLISSQGLQQLYVITGLLVFVLAVFLVTQGYDLKLKTNTASVETHRHDRLHHQSRSHQIQAPE